MIFFLTISEFINLIRQGHKVLVVLFNPSPLLTFFTEPKQTSRKGVGLPRLSAVIGLGLSGLDGASFLLVLSRGIFWLLIPAWRGIFNVYKVKYEEPVDHS